MIWPHPVQIAAVAVPFGILQQPGEPFARLHFPHFACPGWQHSAVPLIWPHAVQSAILFEPPPPPPPPFFLHPFTIKAVAANPTVRIIAVTRSPLLALIILSFSYFLLSSCYIRLKSTPHYTYSHSGAVPAGPIWSTAPQRKTFGWHTAPRKGVTLPQLPQTYFISATIGEHTCRGSPVERPQYRQMYACLARAGEQRCERVFVTLPQAWQVYTVGFFAIGAFAFFFFVACAIMHLPVNLNTFKN